MVRSNIAVWLQLNFKGSITILQSLEWAFTKYGIYNFSRHHPTKLVQVVYDPLVPGIRVQALDSHYDLPLASRLDIDCPDS